VEVSKVEDKDLDTQIDAMVKKAEALAPAVGESPVVNEAPADTGILKALRGNGSATPSGQRTDRPKTEATGSEAGGW
jgi:hypothetical protein